jgi:hypothetical protein
MNKADIRKRKLRQRQTITLQTIADDGIDRRLEGLEIKAYEIPEGCIGGPLPRAQRSSACRSSAGSFRIRRHQRASGPEPPALVPVIHCIGILDGQKVDKGGFLGSFRRFGYTTLAVKSQNYASS